MKYFKQCLAVTYLYHFMKTENIVGLLLWNLRYYNSYSWNAEFVNAFRECCILKPIGLIVTKALTCSAKGPEYDFWLRDIIEKIFLLLFNNGVYNMMLMIDNYIARPPKYWDAKDNKMKNSVTPYQYFWRARYILEGTVCQPMKIYITEVSLPVLVLILAWDITYGGGLTSCTISFAKDHECHNEVMCTFAKGWNVHPS